MRRSRRHHASPDMMCPALDPRPLASSAPAVRATAPLPLLPPLPARSCAVLRSGRRGSARGSARACRTGSWLRLGSGRLHAPVVRRGGGQGHHTVSHPERRPSLARGCHICSACWVMQ